MLHVRVEVLASLPGAVYSVAKAVPGFLQVSDLWRWLINNAVALWSRSAFAAATQPTLSNRLITGFGFDFLSQILSGSNTDRPTLQLVGTLFASTLVPGLLGALVVCKAGTNRVTCICHTE
eukprot:5161984-Amphidinium_carterae.1